VLSDFSYCGMQSEADRDRILSLGAPAEIVEVCGNLKYDLSSPSQTEQKTEY
jgi:3-deoxy-D-manno-octulosonic-acid transferase